MGISAIGAVVLFAFISSPGNGLTSGGGIHFAHFEGDGFSFDYLDEWQVLSRFEHAGEHGPTVLAAVGIGDFDLGCTTTSDSVTCPSSPRWTLPADGVVLAYRFDAWLGPIAPQPTPTLGPGDAWVEVGGRGAILTRTDTSMVWHFPGAPEYIEARWSPEVSTAAPGEVQMAIDTWQWFPPGSPTSSAGSASAGPTPSRPPVDVEGAFVGDLALGAPCSWVSGTDGIAWEIGQLPDGYSIRFEGRQEPVLVGPDGAVVARAGDRLGLNGTKDPPDVGSVCMVGRVLFVTEVVFVDEY